MVYVHVQTTPESLEDVHIETSHPVLLVQQFHQAKVDKEAILKAKSSFADYSHMPVWHKLSV